MDVFDCGGSQPFGNACDFDRVHGKGSGFNDHSKVLHFADCEGTFLELEVEVELLHTLKDSLGVCSVFCVIVRVDKEVIHIDDKPSFCDHVAERVRHESLERRGGVCHAEKHDRGLIESSVGDESGLPLIAFLDMDIVVSPSYIKLSKDLGVFEFVDEV